MDDRRFQSTTMTMPNATTPASPTQSRIGPTTSRTATLSSSDSRFGRSAKSASRGCAVVDDGDRILLVVDVAVVTVPLQIDEHRAAFRDLQPRFDVGLVARIAFAAIVLLDAHVGDDCGSLALASVARRVHVGVEARVVPHPRAEHQRRWPRSRTRA